MSAHGSSQELTAPPVELDWDAEGLQHEKLALIGRMASSIAHEVRNPLATIVATAQSLLAFWTLPGVSRGEAALEAVQHDGNGNGRLLPPAADQLREDLELVLAEARRAGEIVGSLLSFARHQPPAWQPVSLSEVVRRVAMLCRHDLEIHGVRLVTPAFERAGGPWVRGDQNQLQQVLVNLISNAQQAISGQRARGWVRVELRRVAGPRVEVIVDDDGPGVVPEVQQAIFDPFYTTKPTGTGLGLAISLSITRAHGGEIRIEDRPEGGARFVVTMPELSPEGVPAEAPVGAVPPAGTAEGAGAWNGPDRAPMAPPVGPGAPNGPRVLLVDDEPGILRVVGRFLRRCGYDVAEAESGIAAVAAIEAGRFDAVVSDLRMPEFSGEDLFRLIGREHPDLVSRFVFTSGDTLRRETLEFLEGAGCPYLQKPYELTDLVRVLAALCEGAAAAAVRQRSA
jgi:two-component system NtrC family sensor kinase